MSFLLHALNSRIARLRKEHEEQAKTAKNARKTGAGEEDNKGRVNTQEKNDNAEANGEGEGGLFSGTFGYVGGAVGSAVNWGWGAMAADEESDDAVEEDKLEKSHAMNDEKSS